MAVQGKKRLSQRRQAALAAARAGIGTRFRAQGRQVGLGLDCVGVALLAAAGAGAPVAAVPAYALSGDHDRLLSQTLAALGCRRVRMAQPGDLIEYCLAPAHRHLAVLSEAGIIHAHAGLGRVVEAPPPDEWCPVAYWALPGVR
jgi:murein DD-endopeptidase / murein LD-carboxypeptidase